MAKTFHIAVLMDDATGTQAIAVAKRSSESRVYSHMVFAAKTARLVKSEAAAYRLNYLANIEYHLGQLAGTERNPCGYTVDQIKNHLENSREALAKAEETMAHPVGGGWGAACWNSRGDLARKEAVRLQARGWDVRVVEAQQVTGAEFRTTKEG